MLTSIVDSSEKQIGGWSAENVMYSAIKVRWIKKGRGENIEADIVILVFIFVPLFFACHQEFIYYSLVETLAILSKPDALQYYKRCQICLDSQADCKVYGGLKVNLCEL